MASRNGMNICISKYFTAVRNCIGSTSKHFCSSRGSLYGLVKWNEPAIHFATVQLVTPIDDVFLCTSGDSVLSIIWKRSRPSP